MAPEGERGRPLSPSRRSPVSHRRRFPLQVLVGDEHGRPVSAPGLARWLARVAPVRARGTISLALVSDGRVRRLNREYRDRDYATDVLSFPAEGGSIHPPDSHPPKSPSPRGSNLQSPIPNPCLGDIVIARGVARRQARLARHSEHVELRVLALHGLLHLLGYDHERDHGEMHREERRLRRKGGLREGLIEREHRGDGSTRTPPVRRRRSRPDPIGGGAPCR